MGFEDVDLMDPGLHSNNPEPFYKWLRDEHPLFQDKPNDLWALSRYEDIVFCSRKTDIFCSRFGAVPKVELDTWPDDAMINKDGRAHTCQRALVSKGFTPGRVAQLESRCREVVDSLIDRMERLGSGCLVEDLARPLPMRMIGEMLGYPVEDQDELLDWTDIYTNAGSGPAHITEEVVEAFQNFCGYHFELLEKRKAERSDDLLSVWLDAEIDGVKMSEDTLLFEHNLILVGGSETTRHTISVGLEKLLALPEQWNWLREHPEGIANAAEEMIRWSTPFVRMRRTLLQDFEMHGRTMREGDQVIMLYPAGNFDERVYEDPDTFNIQRSFQKRPALSFGWGKHYCLGASLARLEIKVVLEQLLVRMPHIQLDASNPPVRKQSSFLRGLMTLPAVYPAAQRAVAK